jgi:hypothetical protein
MSRQIHTYTELKQQIHEDLRTQHPEWILPNGKCPECDEHESRLRELLEAPGQIESTTEKPAIDGKGSNNPSSP